MMKLEDLEIGQVLEIKSKLAGWTETRIVTLVKKFKKSIKCETDAGMKLRIDQGTLDHPNNTVTIL